MINSNNQPKAKPTCALCQAIRRFVFLAAGLALFAFFAYSPELRKDVRLADLLGYITLENVLHLISVALLIKLAWWAAEEISKR